MSIKIETPDGQPDWLQKRHRDLHVNLQICWYSKVEGCQECAIEIIWKKERELVEMVCKLHFLEHRNLLTSYYYVRGSRFNACRRCIDNIFFLFGQAVEVGVQEAL